MEGDFIKIKESLLPLSWIYGCGVRLRNFCFDVGILKSHTFHVPIIAVGNITVGGTGKTPHVEYLVRMLQKRFHVAVLSRGYKRKTKGFVLADRNSTTRDIGDESFQIKTKYPDISVAVDKKRVNGIQRLTDDDPNLDIILLDDAFQHRYVKPGVNILLVDYHRLIIYDKLLPAGRLREPLNGKNRADIVIITKCPKELKPMEFRVITKAMNLFPYQHLYFTTLEYGTPTGLFNKCQTPLSDLCVNNILLLTGIASPRQLKEDMEALQKSYGLSTNIKSLAFSDHHAFRRKDIQLINSTFEAMPSPKVIITTEKDAARLASIEGLSDEVRQNLYVLPVNICFMQKDQEEKFNDFIVGYILKNSRNSILAKGKDDGKAHDTQQPAGKSNTISFK